MEPKYKYGSMFFVDDRQLRRRFRWYWRWLPSPALWRLSVWTYRDSPLQWILAALPTLPLIGVLVVLLVFVPPRIAEFILLVLLVGMTYWALRNWEG